MSKVPALALLLAACTPSLPYSYEMKGMKDGLRRYHVSCKKDASVCWDGARDACKGDYTIEDREGRMEGVGLYKHYAGDMLVVCKEPQ